MRSEIVLLILVGLVCADQRKLNNAERNAILDKHNEFRRTVAKGEAVAKGGTKLPIAGDMHELEYDTTLEDLAFSWASNCRWNHSGNGGENMFASQEQATDFSSFLIEGTTSWFNEIKNFDASGVQSFQVQNDAVIGHFTQVIWGATSKLGCAVAACPTLINEKGSNWLFLVCNYQAQGNVIGEPIYTTAKAAASACPSGTSSDDSLCANPSATPLPTDSTVSVGSGGTTVTGTSETTVAASSEASESTGSSDSAAGAVTGSSTVQESSSADPGSTADPSVRSTTRGCRSRGYPVN
ncbi:unnamed protein product [Bursaphelenchus xylophilus]|uniref:(pine wood nematode) hypothetical protein n=1 Tax=Bursaphelenchus xylophilus TaxID=6326 RepID=A0A1I7RT51_BURXY|nr:venom allergen-like protein [Bursaphelenchus xylophilus]CAD5231443.1 unnamed protein product [Bursaphelenchus xylophilus]CAG9122608.1 unnamed protein product [Bursaphelenchus xylophilus]